MTTFKIQFSAYGMTKIWPVDAPSAEGALRMFKDWVKINKIRATNIKIV